MAKEREDKARGILNPAEFAERVALHRFLPSAALAPYIEHFWTVSWALAPGESYTTFTIPFPSVHMVFEPAGAYLQGGTTRRFSYVARGHGSAFSVKFHPGGFFPLYRAPIARLTDRRVSLERLFGNPGWAKRAEGVRFAGEVDRKIALAEELLLERLDTRDDRFLLAREIVAFIASSPEITRVAELRSRYRMSLRTLQALFSRYVGVGPKWVICRCRMHEAIEQLHSGTGRSLVSLAHDLGYADQAHFTRDFKAVTGITPGQYLRDNRGADG